MTRLRYAEDNMLSRLARIPERDRQTDGRTGGWTELLYQYRADTHNFIRHQRQQQQKLQEYL